MTCFCLKYIKFQKHARHLRAHFLLIENTMIRYHNNNNSKNWCSCRAETWRHEENMESIQRYNCHFPCESQTTALWLTLIEGTGWLVGRIRIQHRSHIQSAGRLFIGFITPLVYSHEDSWFHYYRQWEWKINSTDPYKPKAVSVYELSSDSVALNPWGNLHQFLGSAFHPVTFSLYIHP